MTSLNSSLPEPMKAFIEGEMKRGAYSTPSAFVRERVRDAQKPRARDAEGERVVQALLAGERIADAPELEHVRRTLRGEVDARLLEALRGGEPTDMTARDWAAIRARVLGTSRNAPRGGAGNEKRARAKARGGRR
jgi:Arc/MetJ-type ribon-helix-helix transcriptional regulator